MICGNLDKNFINLEFVPLDNTEFKLEEVDVTDLISKEEVVEKVNDLVFDENTLIEIILIGKRSFEIDKYELYRLISNDKVVKVKDKTKISYDLEVLANENTLKGLFAKKMLEKLNNQNLSDNEKLLVEKAIEIGFEALE